MSEQEKPWYTGVKWTDNDAADMFGDWTITVAGETSAVAAVISNLRDGYTVSLHAALIAAAPETATERDSLKAEVSRLTEAVGLVAGCAMTLEALIKSGAIRQPGLDETVNVPMTLRELRAVLEALKERS